VAFFDGGQRRGADDGHPVGARVQRLLGQGFTGIGHFPVGDDDFSGHWARRARTALALRSGRGWCPLHDIDVVF
jgi:hypothetical protein